jgi:hypothetical protein
MTAGEFADAGGRRGVYRWGVAVLVSLAIAISYLDRQTLPWALQAIQADIPFSNQVNRQCRIDELQQRGRGGFRR